MIGLFGGTFDPIHSAHVKIALDAQKQLAFEEIRFIPLHHAVHRNQPSSSAADRVAMLTLALQDHPRLCVDERELSRKGHSYTVDTLESLKQDYPQQMLCLLMGSDSFNGFLQWKQPERILSLSNILVMQRPGYRLPDDKDLETLVVQHLCEIEALKQRPNGGIGFQTVTQLAISSSLIREQIIAEQSTETTLPQAVSKYIRKHQLYR